ncbi:hypothetical protein LguiA_023776 [Lonicera macranthoides]
MNRSFRAQDRGMQRQQMGSLRSSVMKEKEDELSLFLEMRKREKERNNLLLHNSEDFDAPLGSTAGNAPTFNIPSAASTRKTDDFLNSDNDKNDYDWLLTPPGTPLFPSLEMESQKTIMSQIGTPKARPTALKSRLANAQPEPAARISLASRQPAPSAPSPGVSITSSGIRRPSSPGGPGSRPATPTGRPTLTTSSKSTLTSSSSKPTSKSSSVTVSKPSRHSTPTSRSTMPSTKPAVQPRSSTPTARSTARSSTPTARPTRSSTPTARTTRSSTPMAGPTRSSTPTARSTVPAPTAKSTSRAPTPTRRPSSTNMSAPPVTARNPVIAPNPVPPRASSPTVKPRPWKPSEMPGFSLEAPPNLRTSIPDRPISATRGRPGAPSLRSSSVEPVPNGRVRRQSCSPSRGRPPNGLTHNGVGGSVPALSRAYAKAKDNVSPGMYGTKMVERVINMRKLMPPKQEDKHSPHSNLSGKSSSSPDSSGFGRSLSKKSLDMAIRHMDIRRSIPGNLRPLMTNIPASSMYSVRSGPTRSRPINVSDSPLATSSNASSEVSVNNNALCVDGSEVDDDINSSDKAVRSPASVRGR